MHKILARENFGKSHSHAPFESLRNIYLPRDATYYGPLYTMVVSTPSCLKRAGSCERCMPYPQTDYTPVFTMGLCCYYLCKAVYRFVVLSKHLLQISE